MDGALRYSRSVATSRSSDTGKPLANADMIRKPPVTLTPLTNHGSRIAITVIEESSISPQGIPRITEPLLENKALLHYSMSTSSSTKTFGET
ncbi:hypothetical protein Ccrd_008311 [Cynara cardunculus var. scolymus]|uniref:Uncharacterized protein n=1 Tax=Cynara cardunculus var. scolymus TaxID=59895 RepID=A0A118JTI5_CYNCS|nr:hypothetical protein Ccrd_008311 [Cynara cardunculus var. scolymus]